MAKRQKGKRIITITILTIENKIYYGDYNGKHICKKLQQRYQCFS